MDDLDIPDPFQVKNIPNALEVKEASLPYF